ncbi:hypothetical protein BGZ72_008296 [Mortierella alpina]|nr:hypothetical protein BGZ72_008296 [Mortierella alpina]
MVSLCAWIVLLASAPHLGLNQPETLVSVRAGERSISKGNSGSSGDSIMKEEEEENSPFASILRSSSPNPPIEHPNSWDDVKQQRQRQQQEELEAMVRAAEEDDVMDSEWVYPSPGMDDPLDDSSALRGFWDTPEELVASNEMETLKEEEQEYQQQQQPEEYIIRLFKYVPVATEVFMFLLAICLGGMSVGLDQVKNQIHSSQTELEQQLEDELLRSHQHENSAQARAHILETMRIDDQRQRHAVWTWACGTLVVMALGLNYWLVISLCHWNIPSLYFVGLGCAGMLLVNSWVLENETGEDTIAASRSEGGRSYYYACYGNEKTERY